MIYLDANVFIYAFVNAEKKGERARQVLKTIREGEEKAATSALTFDEVFWSIKKEKGFEEALEMAKVILETPNLIFLEVNGSILWEAYEVIKNYKLDPRDAIHAACAIIRGIYTMISDDPDFDKIKDINRKEI